MAILKYYELVWWGQNQLQYVMMCDFSFVGVVEGPACMSYVYTRFNLDLFDWGLPMPAYALCLMDTQGAQGSFWLFWCSFWLFWRTCVFSAFITATAGTAVQYQIKTIHSSYLSCFDDSGGSNNSNLCQWACGSYLSGAPNPNQYFRFFSANSSGNVIGVNLVNLQTDEWCVVLLYATKLAPCC